MPRNFEKIYKSISLPTKRFIAKRTGAPPEVIEEIFSNTMVSAWKAWQTFGKKSSYFTWVCSIALHKIADYYRAEIHAKSEFVAPFIEDLIEPDKPTMEEEVVLSELKLAVGRLLQLMPENSRRVLRLRYWEDKTMMEIGRILGTTAKGAEARLYRARGIFAKLVAKNGLEKV